jgi:hypothetical protein
LDRRTDLFRWTILLHNEVNKALNKPPFTETQVIDYYKRLGERQRSPVITSADFAETDMRSFTKGLGVGIAVTAAAGIVYWLMDKST